MGGFERTDDERLHLGTGFFPSGIRVGPQDLNELLPKRRITVGELEGEGWEYCLEVVPVLEVSRAKEAGSELPVREARIGERLGDGRFPRPGEAIQPEDALILFLRQPLLELEENFLPCPPQAPLHFPRAVAGICCVAHTIEQGEVRRFLFAGQYMRVGCQRAELTINRQLFS